MDAESQQGDQSIIEYDSSVPKLKRNVWPTCPIKSTSFRLRHQVIISVDNSSNRTGVAAISNAVYEAVGNLDLLRGSCNDCTMGAREGFERRVRQKSSHLDIE